MTLPVTRISIGTEPKGTGRARTTPSAPMSYSATTGWPLGSLGTRAERGAPKTDPTVTSDRVHVPPGPSRRAYQSFALKRQYVTAGTPAASTASEMLLFCPMLPTTASAGSMYSNWLHVWPPSADDM